MAKATRTRRARRSRTRRRRTAAIAAGLAVAAGGSAVGVAATSDNGPSRRVATVTDGSVTQTVESSGAITSSLKVTPSFPTSGTVDAVRVKVGDTVHSGQTLARLDATALQTAVDSANSTLAKAQQQLEADETGQTTAGAGNASGTTAAYLVGLTADKSSGTSLNALVSQIEAAQAAVIAAQKNVDAGQSAVDTAQRTVDSDVAQNVELRDAQQAACDASAGSSPSPTGSSSSSSGPSADCSTAMTAYEASADTLATDMATLDAKIATQDKNTSAVQQAVAKLDALVAQLKTAATSDPGSSAGGGSGQSGGSGSGNAPSDRSSTPGPSGSGQGQAGGSGAGNQSGSGSAPSGGASGQGGSEPSAQGGSEPSAQPASAAQIAADQAAIDAAQAQVAAADQNLAATTLKSPVDGKIAAVGLAAGQSSSGKTITVVGTGRQGVDVAVPLAEVDQLKPGQRVAVSADGATTALHGTVESVGLVSSTSGSTTTFPVSVELESSSPHLYDGTGADVVITSGTANDVLTVPNSAVHAGPNGTHTVTVLDGGKTSTVPVTLGVTGDDVSQIKSGLEAGQQVVLADLNQPLPTSTNSTSGTFRPGQFGGAGAGRAGGAGTGR